MRHDVRVLVIVRTVTGESHLSVYCESDVGDLVGHWRGDKPPEGGSEQHVELDAAGPLVWSEGHAIAAPDGVSEHGQALTGLVEDVEGDSVFVRVGGSIVLLEVEGKQPIGVVGGPVTVRPSAFELWPTSV